LRVFCRLEFVLLYMYIIVYYNSLKFLSFFSERSTTSEVFGQSGPVSISAPVPSPPSDIIWAMMTVWMIRGKIIRTVLCCVVYDSCAQWCVHIWPVVTVCWLFLKDESWFPFRYSFLCICLGLAFCVFFWFSLDYLILCRLLLLC